MNNIASPAPPVSKNRSGNQAFTIVELLIVVVVIAILAAITIVAYNGISNQAKQASLKSDLTSGTTQLNLAKTETDSYPADGGALKKSDSTTFQYSGTAATFCLTATSAQLPGTAYHATQGGAIEDGACPPLIQTITNAACPMARTLAMDARDGRTYWVQKMTDNNCWMLTNLAYAGGGTNTYSDVKVLQDGTVDSATTYLLPKYYIPSGANATTIPSQPSTSTDGGAASPQYGYLYNWCAAMGAQLSTSACALATTPAPSTSVSACPSGWRLPTGNTGEFQALNTAINGGSTTTDVGLRTAWFVQRAGFWSGAVTNQGTNGYYWSATQNSNTYAHALLFASTSVSATTYSIKYNGFSVRCVAV